MDDIIKAIASKIYEDFGQDFRIYSSEDIKQSLKEPCFFVDLINCTSEKLMGNRYFRCFIFDILYFPEKEGNNSEMQEVGEKLFGTLEYIMLANGDLLRATNKSFQVVDGVLHFNANYQMHLIKETEKALKMENLKVEEGVMEDMKIHTNGG